MTTTINSCDPGFASLGLARVCFEPGSPPLVLVCKTVRTTPEDSTEDRLQTLALELLELGQADYYVTEDQEGAGAGAAKRGETNAKALYVREVQGMMRMVAVGHTGRQPVVITPVSLRRRLGLVPTADKAGIEAAVRRIYADEAGRFLDPIKNARIREHACDALALAYGGWHSLHNP